MARARKRVCQCASPVGTVKAAGTDKTRAPACDRAWKRAGTGCHSRWTGQAGRRAYRRPRCLPRTHMHWIRARSRRSGGPHRTGATCRSAPESCRHCRSGSRDLPNGIRYQRQVSQDGPKYRRPWPRRRRLTEQGLCLQKRHVHGRVPGWSRAGLTSLG